MPETYPITEFDDDRSAFIRPHQVVQPVDISSRCVLCFFAEAVEAILAQYPHRQAATLRAESVDLPVYELEYKGEKLALMLARVGAPAAAIQMEELAALGCKSFIACGSCGVLQKDIAVGHLIIPTAAVRDEGTSYHYAPPSRDIHADEGVVEKIAQSLAEQGVPFIKAKTWTTDAIYRETNRRIAQRKAEGCVTVEMEAAAYMAVAAYNGLSFGQILYAGDNLGGAEWDSRNYNTQGDIRAFVLQATLEACLQV